MTQLNARRARRARTSTGEFPQVVRRAKCARILQLAKSVTDSSGRVAVETANATSWLLGLRYLSQGNTTYIAEVYHNGAGYSEAELTASAGWSIPP